MSLALWVHGQPMNKMGWKKRKKNPHLWSDKTWAWCEGRTKEPRIWIPIYFYNPWILGMLQAKTFTFALSFLFTVKDIVLEGLQDSQKVCTLCVQINWDSSWGTCAKQILRPIVTNYLSELQNWLCNLTGQK